MSPTKAIVGVHEFIGSGSLLLPIGERAQIFPFDDDLSYSIFLRISIDNDITNTGGWTTDSTSFPSEIHIRRPWLFGSNVLSYGVGVAQTENELIYMCVSSSAFGQIDNYQIFANYAVYKRRK